MTIDEAITKDQLAFFILNKTLQVYSFVESGWSWFYQELGYIKETVLYVAKSRVDSMIYPFSTFRLAGYLINYFIGKTKSYNVIVNQLCQTFF